MGAVNHAGLNELRYEKYQRLYRHLLGAECPLAVCDTYGQPVWISDYERHEISLALKQLADHEQAWFSEVGWVQQHDIDTENCLIIKPLDFEFVERVGYLVAFVNKNSLFPGVAAQALDEVAAWLVDEFSMVRELTDMAEELGERYEELNLLCRVEEKVSNKSAGIGRNMLRDLVTDFRRYLDLDTVALLLPDKKYEACESNKNAKELNFIISKLGKRAYNFLKRTRKSLVLNSTSDSHWAEFGSVNIKLKLMVAPVADIKSEIAGLVMAINDYCKNDFTNSDRKLLEVLAEQATAVLQSSLDPLTGLLNRGGLDHHFKEDFVVEKSKAVANAFIYLDLDQFKLVNDTSGYDAGDELLKQIAGLLNRKIGNSNALARLGGDEFAILVQNCSLHHAEAMANALLVAIKDLRFVWEDKLYDITTSIGVAPIKADSVNVTDALCKADTACSIAKQQGRNRVHVYQENDASYAKHYSETQWIPRINVALEENRFCLFAQPIVPIRDRYTKDLHYEILLRLFDEKDQIVPPFAFLPAAERFELMPQIDRWVVRHALALIRPLALEIHRTTMLWTINLSGQSLSDQNFLRFVLGEIERNGVPYKWICFEITETAVISNLNLATDFISALRGKGCHFALDDFGSGLSSFSYLKNLPVDYLKIDGFFIKEILNDAVSYAMVESINRVGQVMGIQTIAEFVEDEATLKALEKIGVTYAQGYGIGMPRPLNEELINLTAEQYRLVKGVSR